MKKLLTFLTLLTLSIGVGWAADVTVTTSISDYAADNNWSNDTRYSSVTMDDNITATASSGTNTGKYYSTDNTWRFYANENAKLTINAASGCSLKSVTLNFTVKDNGTISYSGSGLTSGTAVSVSGTAAEFTISQSSGSKGKVFIKSISVTYSDGGSNPPTPTTYSITYTTPTNGSFASGNPTEAIAGDPVEITTTPDEGYALSALTVTPSATVTLNGNNASFTMPSSAVTVAATFSKLNAITVTGGQANPTSAYEGQTVTVTPTIPNGKVVDQITTTPSDLELTASGSGYTFTMPDQAVTVTFTFKDKPTQTGRFERINSTTKLEKDARYLLVYEDGPYVMGTINTSGSTPYGNRVEQSGNFSYSNGVITLEDETDAKPLILGGTEGAWTFELDGKYLYWSSGNSLTTNSNVSNNSQWTISIEDGDAIISNVNTPERRIFYNTSSPRFACYGKSNSGVYTQSRIQLYKEVGTIVESSDLYIVGQVNGNDEDPFDTNEGVKLTYSQSNDNYSGDFYCTGMNGGYSYFLFSKKVPFSWSDTGDLYGSGASNSYWAISEDGANESHFGDVIPLYAGWTNSFRLPAGLYTVTVDLSDVPNLNNTDKSIVVTKRNVTMTISPSNAYFDDTYEISMASNLTELGGKIYYTTDGGNPSDPNSSRQEYTGPITISATTTFKAVAFVGNLYSGIVEKSYYKKPGAPTIDPNGGNITEATQVTITAGTNGTAIKYTLDGSNPGTSETAITVNATTATVTIAATTTLKAVSLAADGTTYSNVTTATFTYSEPIVPGTGDFTKVTSKDYIKAGYEYIIVTEDYEWAMGSIKSNAKADATQDFTVNSNSTITAGSSVNIMRLGKGVSDQDNQYWTLTQESNGKHLLLTNGSGTGITEPTTYIPSGYTDQLIINLTETTNYAIITSGSDHLILYQEGSGDEAGQFGNYSNQWGNGTGGYKRIYLYYRAPESKTLAQIEAPENAVNVGTTYSIADPYLLGVESREDGADLLVWCKDDNGAEEITPAEGVTDFMQPTNAYWDQSNWVVLRFKGGASGAGEGTPISTVNHKISNIVGKYTDNNNYEIEVVSYNVDNTTVVNYEPNEYCVANFIPEYWGAEGYQLTTTGKKYFFMTPKVQEVCQITYAEWNSGTKTFQVPTSSGFEGSLNMNWAYNEFAADETQADVETTLTDNNVPTDGKLPTYEFKAIVQRQATSGGSTTPAPSLKGSIDSAPVVYPMDLTSSTPPVTAISTIMIGNGEVKSVKYVNVAGVVSDRPFSGVNIVVTEYSDGSRTTTKMLRK